MESSDYLEQKTPPITIKVRSRKGFLVVTCSDYNEDAGKEERFNIQQFAPSEHEIIILTKSLENEYNKMNAPNKYPTVLDWNAEIFVTQQAMFVIYCYIFLCF